MKKQKLIIAAVLLYSLSSQAQTIVQPNSQQINKDLTVKGKIYGAGTVNKFLMKATDGSYTTSDININNVAGLEQALSNVSGGSLPDVVTPGTVGSATKTLQLTYNSKGQLTGVVEVPVSLGFTPLNSNKVVTTLPNSDDYVSSSRAIFSALVQQNVKLKTSLDSSNQVSATLTAKAIKDSLDKAAYYTPLGFGLISKDGGPASVDTSVLHGLYRAWANGTAYTPPVSTVDNSLPSAGFTVKQYFDFSDLAGKSKPYNNDHPQGNAAVYANAHEVDGSVAAIYSTDGDFISTATSTRFAMPSYNNLKIYTGSFQSGKTIKLTLYGINSDASINFTLAGNVLATDGVIADGNYTATLTGNGGSDGYIYIYNQAGLSFSAFKLEVQN